PHAADECRGANELRPTTTSSTDPGSSDGHDTMCVRSDVLELERQS
ncbi:MAG: hypothetical protein JWO46_973, partial [Nocardioidaceae bacterium]|nr:hypothetical protein [Nocardioidaceae bacterium]